MYEASCVADLREGQPPAWILLRMISASVLTRNLCHSQAASGRLLVAAMPMCPGVVTVIDWLVRAERGTGRTLNLKPVTSCRVPKKPRFARHMATLPLTWGLAPRSTPGLLVATPC